MKRHQRGVALLVVLWATALLTIMLAAYAVSMRTEGLQARYQFDQTRARYAAEAGIARAVYGLRNPDLQRRWITDGRPYRFRFAGARVTVRLHGESGKVDLNTATGPILTGLFRAAGLDMQRAQAMSDAVQDWRDADNATRPQGAERAQYREAGRDYGPRNGPFLSLEELQMVLGMTPSLYTKLAPAITIWSGRSAPVIGSAPLLALESLPGVDARRAAAYVKLRRQRDNPLAPLPPLLGGAFVSNGNDSYGAVDIDAEAMLPNGARAAVDAIVRIDVAPAGVRPYRILHWQLTAPVRVSAATVHGIGGLR